MDDDGDVDAVDSDSDDDNPGPDLERASAQPAAPGPFYTMPSLAGETPGVHDDEDEYCSSDEELTPEQVLHRFRASGI
jgi:hypothetical protein